MAKKMVRRRPTVKKYEAGVCAANKAEREGTPAPPGIRAGRAPRPVSGPAEPLQGRSSCLTRRSHGKRAGGASNPGAPARAPVVSAA